MAEVTAPSEPTAECCSPAEQATCCEPSEKATCCGTAARGGTCGCSGGTACSEPTDLDGEACCA